MVDRHASSPNFPDLAFSGSVFPDSVFPFPGIPGTAAYIISYESLFIKYINLELDYRDILVKKNFENGLNENNS